MFKLNISKSGFCKKTVGVMYDSYLKRLGETPDPTNINKFISKLPKPLQYGPSQLIFRDLARH